MKDLGKIVLHIPARGGSKRVPKKNMRFMDGKPMISYTIEASINSKVTNNLYVNTDSKEIREFVEGHYGEFKVYLRDKKLSDDNSTSDEFNIDIIKTLNVDTLIMVNPVCPLITSDDISKALQEYLNSDCDTLITSSSTKMQTFCNGNPVNIDTNGKLKPSQDNDIVQTLNWGVTIWDAKSFKHRMDKLGYASLGGKLNLFDINPLNAIKVSEEKDFILAEKILKIW